MEASMKLRSRGEIRDNSAKQGFVEIKIILNKKTFERTKDISKVLNTYASEIVRQLISDFIDDYKTNNEINLKFLSKKELTEGLSKEENKDVKLAFNREDYNSLRRIAEENNTYASEIIRQLMADFVEKYEQEHSNE